MDAETKKRVWEMFEALENVSARVRVPCPWCGEPCAQAWCGRCERALPRVPRVDLTKWEENFIESLRTYVTEKERITPRQLEVLEKIYEQRKP